MTTTITHMSDCARHNEPAYPAGPCTCGAVEEQCSMKKVEGVLCVEVGIWVTITPDGKTFVSCDDHVVWMLYGDGKNTVFTIGQTKTNNRGA